MNPHLFKNKNAWPCDGVCPRAWWRLPSRVMAFALVCDGVCLGVLPFFIFILRRFTFVCHTLGHISWIFYGESVFWCKTLENEMPEPMMAFAFILSHCLPRFISILWRLSEAFALVCDGVCLGVWWRLPACVMAFAWVCDGVCNGWSIILNIFYMF